jgi:hypothetical protein
MSIQKSANLVAIKAREKLNRRHRVDIPRIPFFAQRRYLSATGGSGKLVIYGWALSMVLSRGRMNRSIASVRKNASGCNPWGCPDAAEPYQIHHFL